MIRLFKVKEKQKELAENANGRGPIKKQTAGELRLHKDISELNLPKSCIISFPNGKEAHSCFLSKFLLSIHMRHQRSSARLRSIILTLTWKGMSASIFYEKIGNLFLILIPLFMGCIIFSRNQIMRIHSIMMQRQC
uniref:Putative RUB1 conjugating enzyme 1 isoform 2 n=1 Tax=Davidia involucrata TaxID=16924 RepID=A0A5B6Z055_DAVIN